MVASARSWDSGICWLSPIWTVVRHEREAVGRDGEDYAWTRLVVGELRNGQLASICVFDVDDEEAAFAYAEERVRASASRLALTNRARELGVRPREGGPGQRRSTPCSAGIRTGSPTTIGGASAVTRSLPAPRCDSPRREYWSSTAASTFALSPCGASGCIWAGAVGRMTPGSRRPICIVHEVGDDGRIVYEGRFDEDDFEGAYRELDRRYYAGEGAAFAEAGATATDWVIGFNRSELTGYSASSPLLKCVSRTDRAQSFRIVRRCSFAKVSKSSTRWSPRRGRGMRSCLGCRRPGSSCDSTGKRSGATANGTSGSRYM